MKLSKILPLSATLAALLMVSGCSDNNIPTVTSSGSAFDGAIANATVCIDFNENEECDANEPSDTTDVYGDFNIVNTTNETGPLFLTGGIDMGTGKAFTGSLSAPAGSTVCSPVTSLVQALIKSGDSAEAAEKSIKTALGIPDGVIVTKFNPFKSADTADGKAVLSGMGQAQAIIHTISVTVSASSTGAKTSTAQAMKTAVKEVAKTLKTKKVNEMTSADVSTAISATANTALAGDVAGTSKAASQADSIGTVAVNTAAAIKTAVEANPNASAADTLNAFNGGIIVVNDTVAADIKTAVDNNTTAVDSSASVAAAATTAASIASDAAAAERKACEDAGGTYTPGTPGTCANATAPIKLPTGATGLNG
ncbi:hypothetical protein GJV85_00790 [Sulfurimonas aquatica]|uniref:Uncharacterized protein n=1 Tax=Sulfurimonas aquatica TaxID=2672570 RepID=A0A975AY96_9BACT|nr:hypothetical protein [Sulfurimonas aquatica]QSZ40713.1 hypothetical protein GJV85_00790 [Sulfurimonas aquatica]